MNKEYTDWIQELKRRVHTAQLKAHIAVNDEMIRLYWYIGGSIVEKQNQFSWGSKIVDQMAKDLKRELPDVNGFSRTNLFAMRKFYLFFMDSSFVHQLGGQIERIDIEDSKGLNERYLKTSIFNNSALHPDRELAHDSILCRVSWRHHVAILSACKSLEEGVFYLQQIIENNWSRNVLEIQLQSNLYERQGKSLNNFEVTLPKPQSDLARETLKDPYKFDFLTLETNIQELQLEKSLTDNITHFLLELGKGYAFVGRQYPLQVGVKERKLDLLFYHLKMHCYVVIDIKMGAFEPEYAGKMNYYLSAVDKTIKSELDNPSIGIILCKSKDSLEVEYALQDLNKPMGISESTFNELPQNLQENLPTIEELENELNRFRE